jgi:dolichol-phosphate mannosyltransferase
VKVSVILPTYNEAGNIAALVRAIKAHTPSTWQREILVVDDNSPDRTYEIVCEAFAGDPEVKAVLRTADRGLAKSIRAGIDMSTGDRIVVMDTDFTHDPVEIPRLLHVGQIYDLVSGSRFCAGGRMQDTRHYLASLAYNWLMRIILRTQVQDNLGGYFTIDANKLRLLPLDRIFFGYGDYFFRLLHYAQKRGFSVVEIPARYEVRHAGISKSNFLKMLITYTGAMVRLRIQSRKEPALPGN